MGKLPDFADWRRPWTEGSLDEEKLARLVYNLKKDVQDRDEKIEAKDQEVATLTDNLESAKAEKSGTDAEAQEELKALRKENRELKSATETTRPEDQLKIDRLSVALELGLSARDAQRLVGKDRDELLEDAKAFAEEHGIEIPGNEDDEDEDPDGFAPPAQRPASRFKTGFEDRKVVSAPSNPKKAAESLPPLSY